MVPVTSSQSIYLPLGNSSTPENATSGGSAGLPVCQCPIHSCFSPASISLVQRVICDVEALPPWELTECFSQELGDYAQYKGAPVNPDKTPNTLLLLDLLRTDYGVCSVTRQATAQAQGAGILTSVAKQPSLVNIKKYSNVEIVDSKNISVIKSFPQGTLVLIVKENNLTDCSPDELINKNILKLSNYEIAASWLDPFASRGFLTTKSHGTTSIIKNDEKNDDSLDSSIIKNDKKNDDSLDYRGVMQVVFHMYGLVDMKWTKVLYDVLKEYKIDLCLEVGAGVGWLAKALNQHGFYTRCR